jgi:uncharacterized protein
MTDDQPKTKSKRGFASMSPEKQREIARMGGSSVPAEKRSFAQNAGLASSAGKKGGKNVPAEKRGFAQNRELAVSAGGKGGRASRSGRGKVADKA